MLCRNPFDAISDLDNSSDLFDPPPCRVIAATSVLNVLSPSSSSVGKETIHLQFLFQLVVLIRSLVDTKWNEGSVAANSDLKLCASDPWQISRRAFIDKLAGSVHSVS